MEYIRHSWAVSFKRTRLYKFLVQVPYLKKSASLAMTVFLPWYVIRKLRTGLKNTVTENRLLASSVDYIRSNHTKFLLENQESAKRVPFDQVAGMLHWPELLVDAERENGFGEFLRLFSLFYYQESTTSNPSSCWVLLAVKNADQLLKYGYDNFKRTIGHNYFNFLVHEGDSQIKAAEALLSADVAASCYKLAQAMPHDPTFNSEKQVGYHYFIYLLWEYVKQIDVHGYLDKIDEPKEGGPLLVSQNGKAMSQDLANSLIEYYSIDQVVPFKNTKTVLEIGSGYGRNAHAILTLNPTVKVILVDILPALYIAQRYLSSIFKGRKVFKATNFTNYDKVKDAIKDASIVFLLPHQVELLPDNYVDLTMNISSFGEMNVEQIEWYFNQINRFTEGHFYTKQWNVSKNPFDGLELTKSDYPVLDNWDEVYSRNCAVQTEFFETLYQVRAK